MQLEEEGLDQKKTCIVLYWVYMASFGSRGLQMWLLQMQKLPPYLTDPALSGSKMDLLMAKAELIRDDDVLSLYI